jgi:hypothetical protein
MTRLNRLALRANGIAVVQTPAALVRVRAPNLKKPAYGGFFAFCVSPGPGTRFKETSLTAGFFAFCLKLIAKKGRRTLNILRPFGIRQRAVV